VTVLVENVGSTGRFQIREGGDGVIYCSCPAWRFSKDDPKMCKHLRAYLEGRQVDLGTTTLEATIEEVLKELTGRS